MADGRKGPQAECFLKETLLLPEPSAAPQAMVPVVEDLIKP